MTSDVEEDGGTLSCTRPAEEVPDCSLPWLLGPGGMSDSLGFVHKMIAPIAFRF